MAPTYVFFTSYARPDNSDTKLGDAIKKLEGRVRAKMGAAANVEIAFFDINDITTGQQWEQRLGAVLRETKIIVCMCSPTYVNSAFCAKEFEVFRRRLAMAADPEAAQVAIVPVVWEPGTFPNAILEYQLNDARLPDAYGKTLGLSHFSRLPSQADKLDDAIEVLADVIDQADQNAVLPVWTDPIVFDDLPSFPHHPKAEPYKNVTLTVLHDDRAQWKMGGIRHPIGFIADLAAKDLQVSLEIVDPNPATLPQRLEQAKTARHMSIIAIDHDDAQNPKWQQMLADIDQAARSNCAVLVGWKQPELTSPADIQSWLKQLLPNSSGSAARHSSFPLNDEKGCKKALTSAIAGLQMALIAEDKHLAQTVDSPVLRSEAEKNGIDVDSHPTVSNNDGGGQ